MKPVIRIKRLKIERIDGAPFTVKPMSHNIPGHEDRMVSHCKRIQREYLDFRGKDGRFYKKYRDKRSKD